MGEGMLDALAEDPFERERKSWAEREEREQKAAHTAILGFEPDDTRSRRCKARVGECSGMTSERAALDDSSDANDNSAMIVSSPPRPPAQDDPEALIPEARERQRRRRLLALATVAVAVALGLGIYGAATGGGPLGAARGSLGLGGTPER